MERALETAPVCHHLCSKYVQGSLLALACFHCQERTVHDIIPRLEMAENRSFVFVIGMEESGGGW